MVDQTTRPRPAIEAIGLTLGYSPDRPVVQDLSFRLDGPATARLDAPNGAGKSTLIEGISGYLRPTHGDLLVCGTKASDPALRTRRRVCRAKPSLHPNLSMVDHLTLAARLAGCDREEPISRAKEFGLDEWFDYRTSTLSTGTAKRLWYVMCTTGEFDVVVLDEPFNGVDEESSRVIVSEINAWRHNSLVLLVAHALPDGLRVDETMGLPRTTGTSHPTSAS
ncbi:ATP-binding cassette domain-containing protein [Cutibacterium equinum]|uniref:ATP-binding cassette domain-containing protein n=1 Tax=Cutibacterium equinum TaxID=3016342 RepID=A0ABY7QZR0_9ACTN|nr:ATP-binding cassette domain-containing protein [Cutibacterium equinum]WCC80190.1 ATP-binding cassette domain-containing protein [Cutibacterium equinum]